MGGGGGPEQFQTGLPVQPTLGWEVLQASWLRLRRWKKVACQDQLRSKPGGKALLPHQPGTYWDDAQDEDKDSKSQQCVIKDGQQHASKQTELTMGPTCKWIRTQQ